MDIRKVVIERSDYGPNKGKYVASIMVSEQVGYGACIEMPIPDDLLMPIVGIIAQATTHVMEDSTKRFQSALAAQLAGPAIEAEQIEPPVSE